MIIGVFLITSCSTKNPNKVSYYLLDPNPSVSNQLHTKDAQLVRIQAIKLPSYLDKANLVMLDSNNKLVFANYHSWADNFSSAIYRVITNDLNASQHKKLFVSDCKDCSSLKISIEHFYPTEQGEVILSGKYLFRQHNKELRNGFFLKENLEIDGYIHSVNKQRLLLKKLAAEINQQIQ